MVVNQGNASLQCHVSGTLYREAPLSVHPGGRWGTRVFPAIRGQVLWRVPGGPGGVRREAGGQKGGWMRRTGGAQVAGRLCARPPRFPAQPVSGAGPRAGGRSLSCGYLQQPSPQLLPARRPPPAGSPAPAAALPRSAGGLGALARRSPGRARCAALRGRLPRRLGRAALLPHSAAQGGPSPRPPPRAASSALQAGTARPSAPAARPRAPPAAIRASRRSSRGRAG
jgi:hypothetical protein